MTLRQKFLIGLICLAVGLTGMYLTRGEKDTELISLERAEGNALVMNTFGTIIAYREDNPQEALAVGFNEADRIGALIDRFLPGSEVYQINSAAGKWVEVSPEVIELLEAAKIWSEKTNGAFDPTITPLVDLWGFIEGDHPNSSGSNIVGKEPPSPQQIQETLPKVVGAEAIEIDRDNSRVRVLGGGQIDLGGIAKGYAADKVFALLEKEGIDHALVSFGGDMLVKGHKEDGAPWKVAIQHPRNPSKYIAVLTLSDVGVVTSGDYERFFEYEGIRYHHIINPFTGYPNHDLVSATIVAPTGMAADAISTAVFSLGLEEAIELIESMPGVDGVLVDKNLEVFVTSGLENKVTFME